MDILITSLFLSIGLMILSLGLTILIGGLVRNKPQKKVYAIGPGNNKRLEIYTKGPWKEMVIWFDGILIDTISDKNELLTSKEFRLPDNSILRIKLSKILYSFYSIQLWRNEEPLHDLEPLISPLHKIAYANVAVAIAGGLYIILSLTLFILGIIWPKIFRIGYEYHLSIILWGLVYLSLSFFSQRKSMIILIPATIIFVLDGIVGILVYASLGYSLSGINFFQPFGLWIFFAINPFGLGRYILGMVLLILMIRGIAALIALEIKEGYPVAQGSSVLMIIIIMGGIAASYYLVMSNSRISETITSVYSQFASPFASFPTKASEPTPIPSNKRDQSSGICWTFELKNFDGNRSQAWNTFLDEKTKKLMAFNIFMVDVLTYNPQLKEDGYVFVGRKTYILPELCP